MNSGHRYSEPGPQRLPPRNEVDLSRDMLIAVLTQLSILIQTEFNGTPLRLVVHGGACILLHPDLHKLQTVSHNGDRIQRRTKTRDVDYIHRSFVAEYASRFPDAGERLQRCIRTTAANFRLGADWMNSDPDPALPMVPDATGKPYDPIYHASIQPNNIHMHTIFTSPNKILTLISVTPFWAVALKLVRYTPNDASDIILILR
ncbi:hypothetical protein C8J56DRAFT_768157 [Mycena floridula]|nr:hypothetical protein C8J56DRAFT_768157 [Mycena floridula]